MITLKFENLTNWQWVGLSVWAALAIFIVADAAQADWAGLTIDAFWVAGACFAFPLKFSTETA